MKHEQGREKTFCTRLKTHQRTVEQQQEEATRGVRQNRFFPVERFLSANDGIACEKTEKRSEARSDDY